MIRQLLSTFTFIGQKYYTCSYVDGNRVEYDERCTLYGDLLGCNAGNQGLNCRFCGYSIYPSCPGPNEAEDLDISKYSSLDYIEGDILLINKTASQYYSQFFESNARIKTLLENQQDANSEVFRNAVADRRRVWENGVVPFTISTAFDQDERSVLLNAMAVIEKYTCVKFVQRSDEKDYIKLMRGGGCFSYVGRSGGRQPLSLGYGCIHLGIAMHEMMHAIGFYHEQSRADRDQYVVIRWENIIEGMEGNFNKYTLQQIDHLGEPYDYTSIMHYTNTAFSKDGLLETIIPRESGVQLIHSAEKFKPSQVDLNKINKLYLCPDRPTTPEPKTTAKPVITTTPDPDCLDKNNLCSGWSLHGHCDSTDVYMKAACRRSCGFCDEEKLPDCTDHHAFCDDWSKAGQCDKSTDYMRYVCPKACNYCNPQCDEFRANLLAASRLQRLSQDQQDSPPTAPKIAKRYQNWPQ